MNASKIISKLRILQEGPALRQPCLVFHNILPKTTILYNRGKGNVMIARSTSPSTVAKLITGIFTLFT